jgi:hypothetical protein
MVFECLAFHQAGVVEEIHRLHLLRLKQEL